MLLYDKKLRCKEKVKDNIFFYSNFPIVLSFGFFRNKSENANFLTSSLIQLILQNLEKKCDLLCDQITGVKLQNFYYGLLALNLLVIFSSFNCK